MSDLQKARELELLRYRNALTGLRRDEQERIENLQITRAGALYQPAAHQIAIAKFRIEALETAINTRINLRKPFAADYPELGADRDLEDLLSEMLLMLDAAAKASYDTSWDSLSGAVRDALKHRFEQGIGRLRGIAKEKIAILKLECALKSNDRKTQSTTTINVITSGGPTIANLGEVRGNIQQVVGALKDNGQTEIAGVLARLEEAIANDTSLAEGRLAYLDQVQFMAEQAVEPPEKRLPSRVQGALLGLPPALAVSADIAQVISVAGPAIALYFGFQWAL